MQTTRRKCRVVTTCIPCYTRKQKCNRQYPCNHCTRRRRPEDCVYNSPPSDASRRPLPSVDDSLSRPLATSPASRARPDLQLNDVLAGTQPGDLAAAFGYSENSSSNTMALLKKLDTSDSDATINTQDLPPSAIQAIRQDLERIPNRQVLDFLVQYFVSELNWMKQIIHTPSFLTRYQPWHVGERLSVDDVEFATLIVRICSYAVQFLPSPSHTVDKIGGMSLSSISTICGDVGDNLAKACLALDPKGSLVRVQHILFAALKSSCEGRTDKFWEGTASASQAAQKAGIQPESLAPGEDGPQELEKELWRRTLCSLYILDSHLSRQLDRVPFLPDNLVAETLPQWRNISEMSIQDDAPDLFTERLMQVQLGKFWRRYGLKQTRYDPIQGEQRYETFCTEYLPTLSPAFALKPDRKWDQHLPKLEMQRQLLHIAIFDSVCWNFRPLLLLKAGYINTLPPYKQVLLQSQKQKLALAALKELDALSALHSLFGGSHTRFAAIIFNTFEAAVLLLCLCSHNDFPFDMDLATDCREHSAVILGLKVDRLTRSQAMRAVEKALVRLQMLAEVSEMASTGARVVKQLLLKGTKNKGPSEPTSVTGSSSNTSPPTSDFPKGDDGMGNWVLPDSSDLNLMAESNIIAHEDLQFNMQFSPLDFPMPWHVDGTW